MDKKESQEPAPLAAVNPASSPMPSKKPGELSAPEKAAIIIALLGPENAKPIVEKIHDRQLRAFMAALENLHQIPRENILGVVADFITELGARKGGFKGGPEAARELAKSMFDEDRVTQLFGTPPPPPAPKTSSDVIWADLKGRNVADLAGYLKTKKSVIVGIVLTQFPTDKAGEILAELPEELAVAAVAEMSRDTEVPQRTIEAIAELVRVEFLSLDQEGSSYNPAAFVGEVLGILPRERRDKALASLEKKDPEQAKLIRNSMLTFEELSSRLPTTAIPTIFREFDQVKLLKMLKAGVEQAPATIEFFYGNISQRMAGQYQEQVDELRPVPQKEADGAISSLMSFISQLERDGKIKLLKREGGDA